MPPKKAKKNISKSGKVNGDIVNECYGDKCATLILDY